MIAIIGAGISGLSLAWWLQKAGKQVALYEASDRVGGQIRTVEKEGFLFEAGPRSLRGGAAATLRLIEDLEMELLPSAPLDRYLYLNGRIERIPSSLVSFLTSPLTRPHLFTFLKELFISKGTDDETVYDFAARRFSPAVAERFFDPLISGIFAGDIRQLSLRAALPALYEMEQRYGSLLKGAFLSPKKSGPLFSFKEGLEALPKELGRRLKVHFHKKVIAIEGRKIFFADNTRIEADHIYDTRPSPAFPRVSVTAVHLGYRGRQLPLKGFGYLIPRSEQEKVLGVVFDSWVFPEQNPGNGALTVMIGGTDAQCIDLALDAVRRHLRFTPYPDVISLSRAERAIPQYPVGHSAMVEELQKKNPHCTCLGNSYYGISVNDCIAKSLDMSVV